MRRPRPVLRLIVLLGAVLFGAASAAHAQERAVAFVGARVIPVDGPEIPEGVVVVQGGRIVAVGAVGQTAVPADAERRDVRGRVLMPGLVDTHSHVGGGSGGDRSAPLHPDVRLLDGFNPLSPTLWRALAGGITTVNVMPGSGHLMSGQTLYVKLRRTDGVAVEDLLFCADALRGICGGMKMANGTNPIGSAPFPGTRARSAAAARALFAEAQAYQRRAANPDSTKRPAPDLRMEALGQVLSGQRTVHFHTHRADDILTVLRLGREFGFTPVLQHVSEGWRVAPQIAASGAFASIILLDSPGGKLEAVGVREETGGILERAGVKVAIHTDDYITDSRLLLRSGAFAVRGGMTRAGALRALTLTGAEILRLDDRVGSLTAGKDADLVVLSGDPFSAYAQVLETWVEGRQVFERARDRRYAVGGFGTYDPSENHVHGADEEDQR